MTLTTHISSAKRGTKSLKTTIPEGVVEFLGLTEKGELEWKMIVHDYGRSVSVRKRATYEDHLDTPDFRSRSVAHRSLDSSSYRGSIHHREEKAKSFHSSSDQRLFNRSKVFTGRDGGSISPKIEEIRRLAAPFLKSDELDEKLRILSEHVLSGTVSETYLDKRLEGVRIMANTMEPLKPLASDKSTTEEDFLFSHRYNPYLMQIPDATRFKLEKIKRKLEPYYEPPENWQIVENLMSVCYIRGNDAFLEDAFEYYKRKAKNKEMRRSF